MEQPLSTDRSRDLHEWHRGYPERKIAGVCAGLAMQLGWSITLVRSGFILLTLFPPFHGLGVWLYLVLWFVMPSEPAGPSGLDRVLDSLNSLLGDGSSRRRAGGWRRGPEDGPHAGREER